MEKGPDRMVTGDALRRVVDRFGQALRAARAGAWEWNVGTNEAFWSDENYELMGLDPTAGDASYDAWLSAVHPDDRDVAQGAVQRAVQEGQDLDVEFRVVLPDGSIRWIRDVGKMVTDGDGNPVAMYGIQMDVTERRSAEQARRQAEERLHRSQRLEAVGTLAGGVAHDFNNLLTVILSAAEALGMRDARLVSAPELREIRDAAQRATALTRQLLSFSRRQATKPRALDLSGLVKQLVPIIRRVIREDIELDLRLASEPLTVHADPAQMDQLLMNLVINARDAMPEGGTLTIETRAQGDDGAGHVLLLVRDTGVGMDEEIAARVFDPFFTTKGPARGSGLGLATVYGIVTHAGGTIDLETAPGRGATFSVRLPVTDEPVASAHVPTLQVGSARPGRVVLLVEDDEDVRRVAERALALAHYRVLSAADADEAMRIAREHDAPIDLVLSDVVMPGCSGVELVERLLRERPGMRVLFMSGYAGEELSRRGVSGNAPLLGKPFTGGGLTEAVEKALA